MDRETVELYDRRGLEWAATHATPGRRAEAEAFAAGIAPGALRIDVGCGAGRYAPHLGSPLVAFDASATMLAACRDRAPGVLGVLGDVEALPFAARTLAGAWSLMTHHHVPRDRLPLALWDLHRALRPGAPLVLQVLAGADEARGLADDQLGRRFFAGWEPGPLADVLTGAGFTADTAEVRGDELLVRAQSAHTLADTVGAGMELLVCGLNPSPVAAERGVGFAGPSNRFWTAATEAGVVRAARDPRRALLEDRVGMTDLAKRVTPRASELTRDEYREGLARVERLVAWLAPRAVCFVGLAGWRAAVDPAAAAGVQGRLLGGRPVYLMPSTSGLNAGTTMADLVGHLRAASALARGR